MSLNVTIPDTFNGPLDLLLHLIRRDEMDIYDIPIARLAASYLEEMRKLAIVDVDEAAEFLDLASRLLEIKSRMLMPPEERLDEEGEEEEDFDPRSGLVEALLEYRRFKDAARMLGEKALVPLRKMMGAEDFSGLMRKAPGVYGYLGARNTAKGLVSTHHNPAFEIDEAVLQSGAGIYAQFAVDYLNS